MTRADPARVRTEIVDAALSERGRVEVSALLEAFARIGVPATASELRDELRACGATLETHDGRAVAVAGRAPGLSLPAGAPVRLGAVGAVLLLVVAALGYATRPPSGPVASFETPNVVVIITDDQSLEMMRALPNTQRLIFDAGTTFTEGVVAYPLCCPARATLVSGQYPHNHGVRDNVAPAGGYEKLDWDHTVGPWLQEAGYETAHVGRTLNDYVAGAEPIVPPGWDHWIAPQDDESRSFLSSGGVIVRDGEEVPQPPGTHLDDVLAADALGLARTMAAQDRPFYMEVGFVAPHTSRPGPGLDASQPVPPPRALGWADSTPPQNAARQNTEGKGKPAWVQENAGLQPQAAIDAYWVAALRSLRSVDDMVAALVGELERAGELDSTLLVFTSDNGIMLGEHGLAMEKVVPYEPAVRVPFAVRGPGFPVQTVDAPASHIDIAPTVLAAAGATPDVAVDGEPLQDVLADRAAAADRALLVEGPVRRLVSPPFNAVRAHGYTLIEYADGGDELYDLRADPAQLSNLIDDPALDDVRAALRAALVELRGCAGADCRVEVPPLR